MLLSKETVNSRCDGISVVVPVYNSAPMLMELVARLQPVLRLTNQPFELILVDDGSRDTSWITVVDLSTKHSWIRGIRMLRNFGQHNALLAGIRDGRFSITVTMDDDLQHLPEELPKLLNKISEGYDVVYGPPEFEQHGFLRNIASVGTKFALRGTAGVEIVRSICAFRVFRTRLRDAFASCQSPYVNIDILLSWGATRFGAVRVKHSARAIGKSNYTIRSLTRHALNLVTGFSILPLQFASIVGFSLTIFGLGILTLVLVRYIISGSVAAGFPFLASIIAIFSGAQLFALGIIGEYLAHIHFRLLGKPTFVISEQTEVVTHEC